MDDSGFKNVREKLFIDPRFQLYFLGYTVGSAVVISSIFFLAGRFFYWEFQKHGEALNLPPQHAFFRFIENQQRTLDLALLLASLVVIVFLTLYGLYVSNRIAGPIHRLKLHMKDYCAGKAFEDVYVRDKDFFPELAEKLNEAIRHAESSAKNDGA